MPDLSRPVVASSKAIAASGGAGALSLLPPMSRLIYRGRISTIGRVAAAFGVEPAMEPCRAAVSGERAALWLGPDEWLLLAKEGEASSIIDDTRRALAPLPHSLVDVSHRQVGFEGFRRACGVAFERGLPARSSPARLPGRHVHAHAPAKDRDRVVADGRDRVPPRGGALLRALRLALSGTSGTGFVNEERVAK